MHDAILSFALLETKGVTMRIHSVQLWILSLFVYINIISKFGELTAHHFERINRNRSKGHNNSIPFLVWFSTNKQTAYKFACGLFIFLHQTNCRWVTSWLKLSRCEKNRNSKTCSCFFYEESLLWDGWLFFLFLKRN